MDEEEWPDAGIWEVFKPKDAAAVLPITPDGDVLLIRQFRAGARSLIEEIPAGLLDVEGEDPASCAARELYEETGFRHTSLEPLVALHLSPGSSSELVHLFVARTGTGPQGEPEEGIEVIRRSFDRAVADARAGRIDDAKSVLALLLADARMAAG
ncbi:MAG TPA: NUDIX hydrolase [Actinomycetota bacterium]|nr:NUDIX hydrolase [Actinomycetota bacterium]